MAVVVEWLGDDADGVSFQSGPVRGQIVIHQGFLFFNKERKCNLRKELAGPPERGEQGEVFLRLVGGRWGSFAFDKRIDADALEKSCQSMWNRAAKSGGPGLAPAVARLLDAAAASRARERSRSRSLDRSPPRAKRLLKRLSSVEVEGMYRLQRVEDLNAEQSQYQAQQQEQIVLERARRKMMTRDQFIESLRKEAELERKIKDAEKQKAEEEQRFEALRLEEERIFSSLQESDQQVSDVPDVSVTDPQHPSPTSLEGEARSDSTACVICHDAQRCVVFLPCKHLVCCAECGHGARRLPQCPMCRARVTWRFKVFV